MFRLSYNYDHRDYSNVIKYESPDFYAFLKNTAFYSMSKKLWHNGYENIILEFKLDTVPDEDAQSVLLKLLIDPNEKVSLVSLIVPDVDSYVFDCDANKLLLEIKKRLKIS